MCQCSSMPHRLKLLRDSGYSGSTSLPTIWTDPVRRQAFSEDVVSDHDVAWLHARLAERVPLPEFWFHFRYLSRNLCLLKIESEPKFESVRGSNIVRRDRTEPAMEIARDCHPGFPLAAFNQEMRG